MVAPWVVLRTPLRRRGGPTAITRPTPKAPTTQRRITIAPPNVSAVVPAPNVVVPAPNVTEVSVRCHWQARDIDEPLQVARWLMWLRSGCEPTRSVICLLY